jgi:two-component system, sensor histidine kinase and response regulator
MTARKHAEIAAQDSVERFDLAVRGSHDGVWDVRIAGQALAASLPVYYSPRLKELLGFEPAALPDVLESIASRVHAEDLPSVLTAFAAHLTERAPLDLECRLRTRSGEDRWFSIRGTAIWDAHGQPTRIAGSLRDVTERKEFEKELARARDEALESARLKSAFVANMSHEIRTPLNIILGYNSMIADHLADLGDDSQHLLLEGVNRAGKRLMETIHAVLDFAKIETGSFETRPVLVDLVSSVARLVADVAMPAAEKRLIVVFQNELSSRDRVIRFDEYCLTHALMNLLQNAIKFTDAGSVTVRLYHDASGMLCLAVQDTGIGIDPGYVAKLFRPFSQEHSGYSRRFDGSGLGLAVTREYLRLNGADIDVRSEKGKGSVFTIRFEPPPAESAAPVPLPALLPASYETASERRTCSSSTTTPRRSSSCARCSRSVTTSWSPPRRRKRGGSSRPTAAASPSC